MDLKNRLFPYPIIGEGYDDYKSTTVLCNSNIDKICNKIVLKINIKTNNDEINRLIKEEKLVYVAHLECNQTSFRKIVKSSTGDIVCEIEDSKVSGKLQVSTFIAVNNSLYNYSNYDFNEDYEGAFFTFEKGNIIGIGEQYNIDINKEKDELGKIPSIFSIIMKKEKDKDYKININDDKILVLLSEEDYINYKKICNVRAFEGVLHSMIVLPTLIYVFEELKNGDISTYEEYRWFRSLRKSLERYKINLDYETLTNCESVKLAQLVLDMPISRGLSGLAIDNISDEEEL